MNLNDFMQKLNGYRQSRILLTAWEIELFNAIDLTDGTLSGISEYLNTNQRATRMLLDVLASLKIISKSEKKYQNSEFSKKYLVKSSVDYLAGLGHSNNLWDHWSGLTESVRTGQPQNMKPINYRDEHWLENFIEAMHSRGKKQAPETIGLLDLSKVKKVLDIGGGSGIFSMSFIEKKSDITATVFDLPNVIPLTKKYIEKNGYAQKITTIPGDYTKDNIGSGYDLCFLSAIIHSNSAKTNLQLCKKCYESLNQSGQIVISDFIMKNDHLEPYYGAEFALNMLVATDEGDTYTENEISEWLLQCGFKTIKRIDLPTKGAMMVGSK